jgi:Uma2 family endonuclease
MNLLWYQPFTYVIKEPLMSTLSQSASKTPEIEVPEKKVWTDAAFMALPDDGHHYEIVSGELVDMGNSGALHGHITIILSSSLFTVVMAQKLGVLFDSSTAFKMKNGNKRSPDIS